MHMADALVSPAVAGVMYAASGAAAAYCVKKLKEENDAKKVPLMGVMGALVFAVQMINFTIPGTGSSGHLCGGMLLTALLGPYGAFLTMISVLLIQCLLFADGGLLALGCNVWNMAFYGCFLGYFLVWKPLMKQKVNRGTIVGASVLGSVLSLQLGAFSVCLETWLSGVSELPFTAFVSTMQPIHLAIGLGEGLITSAVLLFVYESRPELLRDVTVAPEKNKLSAKKVFVVLFVVVLLVAGALSLYASANPDGLEWSIGQLTGSTEVDGNASAVSALAERIQGATSLLPDYSFRNSDSVAGTSVSGIFGSVIVLALAGGMAALVKSFHKKKGNQNQDHE